MNTKEMLAIVQAANDALDRARSAQDYNYYRQAMTEALQRMEALKTALQQASKGE